MDLSIKRILKDVKMLRSGNLESLGIYYKHNEDNIYNIKVLMIGPNDTPYNYGYYLFNITFPPNYPFSPPSVKYYTQGEQIRFNPNLYTNGKVCLSLLNTWNGPQWSSCNSLLSILISMQSMILIKNPIINEPGYENDTSEHALKYTQIIEYSNYNIAICKMINETPSKFFVLISENSSGKNPFNDTANWKEDKCSKNLNGCLLRFGNSNVNIPFGGFPGTVGYDYRLPG